VGAGDGHLGLAVTAVAWVLIVLAPLTR
jgi:hypothetical protein